MEKILKKILRKPYHFLRWIFIIRWIKTIRVNFALLPSRQAVKLPIVITSKVIFDSLKGKVIFDCPVKFGLVNVGKDIDNMPIASSPARLFIAGTLTFKGKCIINRSSNIVVWPNSKMELGKYIVIGSGIVIKSGYSVKIGDYTRLASGSFVMDTNVHLIKDFKTGIIKRVFSPIDIGKGCWIAMNTSILGGTKLPDYCITARYSQLNKDYSKICEQGSILAGAPAKMVKDNIQRLYNITFEQKVTKFFMDNPEVGEYQGEPGIEVLNEADIISLFKL